MSESRDRQGRRHEPQIALPGSERVPLPNARRTGPVDPDERIEVTLMLRPRGGAADRLAALGSGGRTDRTHLSRRSLAAERGADPDDVAAVREFARAHDLTVGDASLPRRRVTLRGRVAAMAAAFGVDLQRWERGDSTYRGRVGPVHVPETLLERVVAVLGLDDRPQAQPHVRRRQDEPPDERSPARGEPGFGAIRARAARVSYSPLDLARIYDFPSGTDGTGQTIAIVELGGGYRDADLQAYFGRLGVTAPSVTAVSVDGATNSPAGSPDSADGEVVLDIEVAGAVAPGAAIAVYFAPNTDRGFLDAITAAIHDTKRRPSIISISWGGPEPSWTGQALQAFDQAFQDAALAGISVFCAAGDNGSDDGVGDGMAHVDFPSSSPHVTGCGGTTLTLQSSTPHETVWNDTGGGATGGGVSASFALPDWQANAGVPPSANANAQAGRGVPDVAADADPATGYAVRVDGTDAVFGGTSAVAPLWAGLTARLNQALASPLGFVNPLLYRATGGFRDVTEGSNGAYSAGPGWDACTGLGSPDGTKLLDDLRGS